MEGRGQGDRMIKPTIAIVDYGMGNLFSIKNACESVGLEAMITHRKEEIINAHGVILPGVGAFETAMQALKAADLIEVLRETADSGKPLIGICLGMQLLMSESFEFGRHPGLGLLEGSVVRLENRSGVAEKILKVPHVGWSRIYPPESRSWESSLLEGIDENAFMYFVHSYYVRPLNPDVFVSMTRYGLNKFCSSLAYKNIFACQFHPERSGARGLVMYRNLYNLLLKNDEQPVNIRQIAG